MPNPNDADVCAVGGLNSATCIAARQAALTARP
jgi:hypothetical protein